MNEKTVPLATRRERLIAQAAVQRTALAQGIEPWRGPLALADQGLMGLRFIKSHSAWIIGGVVLLASLRLRRSGKWLRGGLVAWEIMHKLRGRKPEP